MLDGDYKVADGAYNSTSTEHVLLLYLATCSMIAFSPEFLLYTLFVHFSIKLIPALMMLISRFVRAYVVSLLVTSYDGVECAILPAIIPTSFIATYVS